MTTQKPNEKSVIVIDDDPFQLQYLKELLADTFGNISSFTGAKEALESMDKNSPPDIIITDLFMPNIDGWKLCRLLRSPEYKAFNHIPILVISATFSGDDAAKITADTGANAFLPMPVDQSDLLSTLASLLNHDTCPPRFKALIVEDCKTLSKILQSAFLSNGYQADIAHCPGDARQLFESEKYDFAVIDYHLPDENGDRLLSEFQIKNPDTVIIMMTTDTNPDFALNWLHNGASAYLRKPFSPQYLVELCAKSGREKSLLRVERLLEEKSKTLRESQKRFRDLFENSRDGFVVVDAAGRFLNANPAYCQMLGYSLDELKQMTSFYEITPERWRVWEQTEIWENRLLQNGYSGVYEKEYIRKDGMVFPVELQSHVLFNEEGSIRYLWGIARDITERKAAETALRESEEKLSSILNSIEDAVLSFSIPEEKLIYISPSFESIFGEKYQEINNNYLSKRIHAEDINLIKDSYSKLMETGSFESEFRLLRPDGTIKWLSSKSRIIYDDKNDPIRIDRLVSDITTRKLAEEELKRRESQLTLTNDNFPGLVSILDTDFRFKYANGNFEKLLGLPPEQVIGKTVEEIIGDENYALAKPHLKEAFTSKKPVSYESDSKLPSGITICGYNTIIPDLAPDGSVTQLFVFGIDITRQKHLEQERIEMERQLLHTQKLESLGVLAGGIAHDFNNLLMAIIGNLDMSLLELSPVSTARERIESAMKASHRAADLTRQMLAYSGKGHFIINDIHLNELIDENTHIFRSSVSRNVSLNLNLAPDIALISADTGQVQQIVMNLMTNASEAIGEDNGSITIATGEIECDEDALAKSCVDEKPLPGKYVFCEVTDTGCGMDEETKAKLFDPFFTTKFTGRGLGMAAVIGIVRGHQGAIFVESEPGRGTKIRVLFPASDKKPDIVKKPPVSKPADTVSFDPSTKTVLIVDDEEFVRDMCNEMVMKFGYRTMTAADGMAAIEIYKAQGPEIDCVILDLSMPKMSGHATFLELKKINPDVKVILSSGYEKKEATEKFEGLDLSGFIQKPFAMKTLRGDLEKLWS